jgi:hypothetical protein
MNRRELATGIAACVGAALVSGAVKAETGEA